MAQLDISQSDILHDPRVVDEVAEACSAQLPADAVLEVDEIVVTGSTAALLVAHSFARRLECRVTRAMLSAGTIEIDPPFQPGQRVVILAGEGAEAVSVSALRLTIERVAETLAVCTISGEDSVTVSWAS